MLKDLEMEKYFLTFLSEEFWALVNEQAKTKKCAIMSEAYNSSHLLKSMKSIFPLLSPILQNCCMLQIDRFFKINQLLTVKL